MSRDLLFSAEKKAIQLHNTLFRYLWIFPIRWNADYTQLEWNTTPLYRPAPTFISYIFVAVYGFFC